MAAANFSGENPLAGAVADIGVEQRGRGPAPREISPSRANGRTIVRSTVICSSVNPSGSFVAQLEAWIEPSVNGSGIAM